jgi:hypothetical protein
VIEVAIQSSTSGRLSSGLYLFASIEMLLCCFSFILFPHSRALLDPAFLIPDAPAELFAALWLAIRGVSCRRRWKK